jgi:hypothetical protein
MAARLSRAASSRLDLSGSKDHEPGAHDPSVTFSLDTFHVEPDITRVAWTPSFSGGVTGGTGLPVAANTNSAVPYAQSTGAALREVPDFRMNLA